jgi:hypothetical protein
MSKRLDENGWMKAEDIQARFEKVVQMFMDDQHQLLKLD